MHDGIKIRPVIKICFAEIPRHDVFHHIHLPERFCDEVENEIMPLSTDVVDSLCERIDVLV